MLYDSLDPARLITITQPFANDQVQVSKSVSFMLSRFIDARPTAPASMNVRTLINYGLLLVSLFDIFSMIFSRHLCIVVFTLNVNMWCSDLHRQNTCSPIAVYISYLMYPSFSSFN